MIPFLHRLAAPAQAEDSPLWLIVLADMMTNLMLFFLVLFAMAQQGPKAREALRRSFDAASVVDPAPAPEDEAARRAFAETRAAERLRALFGDTELEESVVRVRLRDRLLFPSGRAELSRDAEVPLAQLARVLKDMPNAVVVEGHTDDVPLSRSPFRSNWELSVARSDAVIERLVLEGVPPARLVASGYGEHRPLAPNADEAGRARNRRVEVLIQRGEAPLGR